MDTSFDINGLVFWDEDEVFLRNQLIQSLPREVRKILHDTNDAWKMFQFEGPILTPRSVINPNYTDDDVWAQTDGEFVLRPETTPSSYVYAQHLIKTNPGKYKAPLCIWQVGKSFRREQDQVSKNMRLKEFYQMEFQCIFSEGTKNDYQSAVLMPLCRELVNITGSFCRVVESDRLPSYSKCTMDVEAYIPNVVDGQVEEGRWMELVSISLRTDYPGKLQFVGKGQSVITKNAEVLEIAIGLDRVVYVTMHNRSGTSTVLDDQQKLIHELLKVPNNG